MTVMTAATTRQQVDAQGFLDLENLLGNFLATAPGVLGQRFVELIGGLHDRLPGVHLVACADRRLVAKLVTAVPDLAGVRVFPGACGKDRADGELIARVMTNVRPSCEAVVLGSGDHAFAGAARRLRASGREVIVVGRAREISWELYLAASEVIELPQLPQPPEPRCTALSRERDLSRRASLGQSRRPTRGLSS